MSHEANTGGKADETNLHKQESAIPQGSERTKARKVYVPLVDIVETDDALVLVSDMPGVDQAGVDVVIEKNMLMIRGKVDDQVPEGYKLTYEEYGTGDYERTFTLPNEIDRDAVQAMMKDGMLKLTLPKVKQAAARKVAVTAG
jgi:HSP20 family molecular chaperone IbpA